MTETAWVIWGAAVVASLAFVVGYGLGKAMEIRRRDRSCIHVGDMEDHRPEAILYSYYEKDRLVHVRNDGRKVTE